MEYIKLKDCNGNFIKGPLVIKPDLHHDERGYFFESWNSKAFNKLIGEEIEFKQDNQSFSHKGVLRGMHFQINPKAQGKLVRVISGSIFDVIVDLRVKSRTFKKWVGVNLSEANKSNLWVPEGFAHGFLTTSENTNVLYKTTSFWDKDSEKSLIWTDKEIGIIWPFEKFNIKEPILSGKDNSSYTISELLNLGILF